MPSFLSRHGSNRLRKVRKTEDEGTTGRTETAGSGIGGGGGLGTGGRAGDPKASLVSFITVSNKSDSATSSLNKIQRSESFKRRFGLNNILTRGKNRTGTGQGAVSSHAGDVLHRPGGPGPGGELEVGSKDSPFPAATSARQQSKAITPTGTTTTGVAILRSSSKKLHKERPNTNNSPTRVIAPVVALPAVSPVLSSPAEFSSQQQQDSMAATATMTSVMQQPKRRSFSLTLTVDELPRHISRTSSSPPPPIPQISKFNSYASSPASPSANENLTPMSASTSDPYSPLFASPMISKATTVGFSRPALVDSSNNLPHMRYSGHVSSTSSIGTPVGYYITPSQTPTLQDRYNRDFSPPPVPTVVRPGPSTPPLTELPNPSSSIKRITDGTTQSRSHQTNGSGVPASEDRHFDNGPPTPASSNSSQKEKDPNRRVNFVEEAPETSTSLVVRNNPGNAYPNALQQNRLGYPRPPLPGRPLSNNLRGYGSNHPPFRGPPRGRLLLRGPPRPPSPIYVLPPDMKTHRWSPLKPNQLECSVGHNMVPFRNKQHSILCTVCRAMEFEGRGEPVKRSFYCSWCAVRMCGNCKEELTGACQGRLLELWDRTEEKRNENMAMVKEGKQRPKRESGEQKLDQGNSETSVSRNNASTNPVDVERRNRPQQETPSQEQSQQQSMIPQKSRTPPPKQLLASQSQQLTAPQQRSRNPQSLQPEASRQRRSRTPQPPQPETPQQQRSRTPQSSDQKRLQHLQQQQLGQPSRGPPPPEKPKEYIPRQGTPANLLGPTHLGPYPPPVPQLTQAETAKYQLVAVPSNQKPPSSGTVVLVGEKQKEPSIFAASLKGSVTKKKRGWLRSFGKKKDV